MTQLAPLPPGARLLDRRKPLAPLPPGARLKSPPEMLPKGSQPAATFSPPGDQYQLAPTTGVEGTLKQPPAPIDPYAPNPARVPLQPPTSVGESALDAAAALGRGVRKMAGGIATATGLGNGPGMFGATDQQAIAESGRSSGAVQHGLEMAGEMAVGVPTAILHPAAPVAAFGLSTAGQASQQGATVPEAIGKGIVTAGSIAAMGPLAKAAGGLAPEVTGKVGQYVAAQLGAGAGATTTTIVGNGAIDIAAGNKTFAEVVNEIKTTAPSEMAFNTALNVLFDAVHLAARGRTTPATAENQPIPADAAAQPNPANIEPQPSQSAAARQEPSPAASAVPGQVPAPTPSPDATKVVQTLESNSGRPSPNDTPTPARPAPDNPAQAAVPQRPSIGEGFDAIRSRLWSGVKAGKPFQDEPALYRAMSEQEYENGVKNGKFRPLIGGDLYVTNDPDRLAGGAYGSKGGGYIVEFSPSPTRSAKSRTVNVDELVVDELPATSIRRVFKFDPKANDHLLIEDRTAVPSDKAAGPEDGATPKVADLSATPYAELRKMAKAAGLDPKGTRAVLVERLTTNTAKNPSAEPPAPVSDQSVSARGTPPGDAGAATPSEPASKTSVSKSSPDSIAAGEGLSPLQKKQRDDALAKYRPMVDEGWKPVSREVDDTTQRSGVEAEVKKLAGVYPMGNDKHPDTIRYRELKARLSQPFTKTAYHLESPDGTRLRPISKTAYDALTEAQPPTPPKPPADAAAMDEPPFATATRPPDIDTFAARNKIADPDSIKVIRPPSTQERTAVAELKGRGIEVVYVDSGKKLRHPAMLASDGKTILIDRNAGQIARRQGLAAHELLHALSAQSPGEVTGLTKAIQDVDPKGWEDAREAYRRSWEAAGHKPLSDAALNEEASARMAEGLVAYLRLGQKNPASLVKLATAQPTAMLRVLDIMQKALRAVGLHKGKTVLERQGQRLPPARIALLLRSAMRGLGDVEAFASDAKFATEDKSKFGRPDLANPNSNPAARKQADIIDEALKDDAKPMSREANRVEARKRLSNFQTRDKEWDRIVGMVGRGESLGPLDTAIAQQLAADKMIESLRTGSRDDQQNAVLIHTAYRAARTDTARALSQVVDPSMTPLERHKAAITEVIAGADDRLMRMVNNVRGKMQAVRDEIASIAERTKPALFGTKPVEVIRQHVARVKEIRARMAELKQGAAPKFAVEDSGEWKALQKEMGGIIKDLGGDKDFAEIEKLLDGLEKKPKTPRVKKLETQLETYQKVLDKQMSKQADEGQRIRNNLMQLGIHPATINDEMIGDRRTAYRIARAVATAKSTKWNKANEYWINAILSGPQTHMANTVSNTLYGTWEMTGQRLGEAILNHLTPGDKSDAPTLGEFRAMGRAIMPAIQRAGRSFVLGLRDEAPVLADQIARAGGESNAVTALEETRVSIGGKTGRAIRVPSRFLVAEDEFFKGLWTQLDAAGRAHRIAAVEEGLKGAAKWKRVDELLSDMSSRPWTEGFSTAERLTFQNELGTVGKGIQSLRRNVPGLRWVIPFVRTPANLLKRGLEKTPLVTLHTIAKGANTGYAKLTHTDSGFTFTRETAIREAVNNVVGWGVTAAIVGFMRDEDGEPRITGNKPPEGLPRTSVKIGGTWYSYNRIDPMATSLSTVIDSVSAIESAKDPLAALGAAASTVVGTMRDKTFLSGLGDLMDAIENQGDTGSAAFKWASNFAVSWVPNIVRQSAAATDTMRRDVTVRKSGDDSMAETAFWRTWQRALPLANRMPPPRVDLWGREQKTDAGPASSFVFRLLSPVYATESTPEEHLSRLIRDYNATTDDAQWFPRVPTNRYTRNGKTLVMTDEQYHDYLQKSGSAAARRLMGLYGRRESLTASDLKKIESVFREEREKAKASLPRK